MVSAKDLGVLPTHPGIRGRDGGYGGTFAGRSVWLYGDTVLEEAAADGRRWRHNSWSATTDFDASDGLTGFLEPLDAAGAPEEFFPQTIDEQTWNDIHFVDDCTVEPCGSRWAVWPGAMVEDAARARALVFYFLVYAEPGDFNFQGVGSSIAVWDDFDAGPTRPELSPGTKHPTLLFGENEPELGAAALVVGDRVYAYACVTEGLSKPCILARASLADALDHDAWRWFAGGGAWSPRAADARPVLDGNDIMTVTFCPALGVYLAVYSQPLGTRTLLRTAPAPEGPWSRATLAFATRKPEGDATVYDALAHPELARDGGRVQYVSYSRSTGFLESEVRLVELTLAAAR